jgi:deoxycytidylate deaminase
MSMITPISAMQMAVDIVLSSPHPANKVAATLFNDEGQFVSKTNDWPEIILKKLGQDKRIGDSSGTVHAEVNCFINSPFPTHDSSLAITDPCCPNCAKCIAESGVRRVYIDHKGFDKDFAVRRGGEFQDMSLHILSHAGISIFEVFRKDNLIKELYIPPQNYIPPEENPIEIRACRHMASLEVLKQTINLVKIKHPRWGCALAKNQTGKVFTLVASAHPAIGYTKNQDMMGIDGKYDFMLEPINRLIMGSAKSGLEIIPDYIWCSVLPTPREMVNLVAYDIQTIYCGESHISKESFSGDARILLEESQILKFIPLHLSQLK